MAPPPPGIAGAPRQQEQQWLSPGRMLALFCLMCIFIYVDRGMIASNGVNGSPAPTNSSRAGGGSSGEAAAPLPGLSFDGGGGVNGSTLQYNAGSGGSADGGGGSGIQGDFGLSLFQDGLLPAAFMVGLLVSSPLFAEASKRHNALRLIGVGLAVWTVAVAGCGLAPGFTPLLLCRMAVGVGEASFVALASPFIDDNAPPARKALWLGIFYCCIPAGFALGYIYGGLVGMALGWRAAFLLEAAAMVPFCLFCLLAPPIDIRGTRDLHARETGSEAEEEESAAAAAADDSVDEAEAGERAALTAGRPDSSLSGSSSGGVRGRHPGQQHPGRRHARQQSRPHTRAADEAAGWRAGVAADSRVLLAHPVYVLTVAGMTCYTAVLGAFSFYGPKAGRQVFGIAPEAADLTFGAITVATGVVGSMSGGLALDMMGATMPHALLLCACGTGVGAVLVVGAFAGARSFAAFSFLFALGQLAMFSSSAPANAVCMWGVPAGLRPFAMSMSVVAMHVLGDVPSPPLLGAMQGALDNWRLSMSLMSILLLVGAAAYAWGMRVSYTATDYRDLSVRPVASVHGGGSGGSGGSGGGDEAAEDKRGDGRGDGRVSPEQPLLLRNGQPGVVPAGGVAAATGELEP